MTDELKGPPTPAAAPSPTGTQPASAGPIGRTIHGRYKIKRLLGEGGMGGVYEGEHLEIGKRVAIKLVHSLHARDPQIAARIKQEARSTGAIESENIVQVFDAGEDPELGLFLVMEMLKGEDLASLLARKKGVSPLAAAVMIAQASLGLFRAHAAGIVHRDLKPANIFLCARDDGSSLVKLVDFGIAKLVRDASQASQGPGLTRMGMVIGTPQYMSPEQAQGLLTVDHRTDIYSLGCVLYEAIVGVSPFKEMPTYEQTILQIMTRVAPRISASVPDVDRDLDQLCAEMMSHDMNARPADMGVVRQRLIQIFPQIEGGRMRMGSLTNEAGFDATISADTTGQVRAQVAAALAQAGLSGTGPAASRPRSAGTQSALAVTSSAADDEPIDDVAGVPRRRSGALVGVVAVVALLVGIGGVALVKTRGEPAPAAASYGLVQSSVSLPAPSAAPPAVAPAPSASAASATVAKAKPAASAPAAATPPSDAPAAPHAAAPKPPRSGAAKSNAAAAPQPGDKPENNGRMVGGTSESTEF
jgi:serine/threonine-protein kinase